MYGWRLRGRLTQSFVPQLMSSYIREHKESQHILDETQQGERCEGLLTKRMKSMEFLCEITEGEIFHLCQTAAISVPKRTSNASNHSSTFLTVT